jgi:uncharacterized protein
MRVPVTIGPLLCATVLLAAGGSAPAATTQAGTPSRIDIETRSGAAEPAPDVVNDYAPALTDGERVRLAKVAERIRERSAVDARVLIVASLGGVPIEEFSIRRARQWGLGAATARRGVLITLAIEDRQSRIEVSRNLEGRLTDSLCKAILVRARGEFEAGRYAAGLEQVLGEIRAAIGERQHAAGAQERR